MVYTKFYGFLERVDLHTVNTIEVMIKQAALTMLILFRSVLFLNLESCGLFEQKRRYTIRAG